MILRKSLFAIAMLSLSYTIQARIVADDVIKDVKEQYAPDSRVAVWTVTADRQADNSVVLRGKTDNPDAKEALLKGLESFRIAYKDSITLLPDASVEKPWALVSISVACLRGEPRNGAELVSQAIMGTPVKVLECNGGISLVQTPDNYIAYVTDSSLQFLTGQEFDSWRKARRVVVVSNLAVLYENPEENIDAAVSDLLLGNILEYKGDSGGFFLVELPDGREGYVKKTDVKDFAEWSEQDFDMSTIERSARRMMGTPYLWGGMSAKMADCSGFVKTAYFSNGIILQRDASQQALTGKKIDVKKWKTDAEPGDLIFIGTKSGRVTHVAMYIGNEKYIHSSGRVKINSMNPADSDYLDYVFLSMSRIKGEVGTKGIVAVRNHEWYF